MMNIAVEPLTASGCSFRLEAIVTDEAFQVCEGDTLHIGGAPWWCKADIPEKEILLAGQQLIGKRVQTLEAVQQGVEVHQGHSHLLKEGTKYISAGIKREGKCVIMGRNK